jgi:hypothetical protein
MLTQSAIVVHACLQAKYTPPDTTEEAMMNYLAIMQHIIGLTQYLRKPAGSGGKKDQVLQYLSKLVKLPEVDLTAYFGKSTKEKQAGEGGFFKKAKEKENSPAAAAAAGNSILSIAQVRPIHWDDVFGAVETTAKLQTSRELLPAAFFQKIELLAVSAYCLATESRFLDEETGAAFMRLPGELSVSEVWLGRSLELVYLFLPHESPLCGQIMSVHARLHGISKQAIVTNPFPLLRDRVGIARR